MHWGFMMLLGHATKLSNALQNQMNNYENKYISKPCHWERCFDIVVISVNPVRLLLAEGFKTTKTS